MYPSPSQYNDFLPGRRGLEKLQDARYGKFIFCSVLLHLVLFFCIITLNQKGAGHLLPGESIVEVNLVSTGKTLPPEKLSPDRNYSVKETQVVNHVPTPSTVIKKTVKPKPVLKKIEETPVISENKIAPPENISEPSSANSSEVDHHPNNTSPGAAENIPATITENIPVNHVSYEQYSMNTSGEYNSDQVSKEDAVTSQRQHYVDKNFYYVKDLITRNLIYPVLARRMKWQGTVEVSFVVLQTGDVENIRIVTSSGHSVLDKNVIAAIQQVQPFPAPPVQAEFTMPIKYTLKN